MENVEILSVSIVTYNNNYLQIKKAIDSVIKNRYLKILYIVDNSPNFLLKELELIPRVEYIKTNKNIGFGAAHNIAINKSIQENLKYHFVLNPDIFFNTDVSEKIIEFMERDPDIGLLMPQIRYPDGSIQFLPKLIPSPFDLLIRRINLLRIVFSKRLAEYELRSFSQSITYNAPIISGCFSCFRVEALKQVGLYDENFFMYFEDFDLSRRMNRHFKTIYYCDEHAFHEYGRGAQYNIKLFKIFIGSAIKYFNKWGWFFDRDRARVNRNTIDNLKVGL